MHYQFIQRMILQVDPKMPYCSIRIYHDLERVDPLGRSLSQPPILAKEAISALLVQIQSEWEASKEYQMLWSILSSIQLPSSIAKIVAFSLSAISVDRRNEGWNRRSAYQHVLVITLRDMLSALALSTPEIDCYVQEPDYPANDTAVLSEHSIRVLRDPQGFLELDDATALISVNSLIPVKQIVAELAMPPLIIWDYDDPSKDLMQK